MVRARDKLDQGLALQGIHTPSGSAFNPVVYLYCLSTENKESFSLLNLLNTPVLPAFPNSKETKG